MARERPVESLACGRTECLWQKRVSFFFPTNDTKVNVLWKTARIARGRDSLTSKVSTTARRKALVEDRKT